MTNSLCTVCKGIFSSRKIANSLHSNLRGRSALKELHNGRNAGCVICIALARFLTSKVGDLQHMSFFESSAPLYENGLPGLLHISMSWKAAGPYQRGHLSMGVLPLLPGTNLPTLCQPMSPSFDSTSTVQLMQTWLHDCLDCHQRCSQRGNDAQQYRLPTRLIDAGSPGAEEFRVIRTDSDTISGRYISLSHRWGQSPFLQLNSKTLSALTKGMAIAELPATFRDAIFIAHKLSIRYLWIDSLCIQQDSREDWIKEAPTMRHVYGFAIVNIIAGHSKSPEDGLFNEREPFLFQPFTIRSQWETQPEPDYLLWDKSALEDDFESAPLTQRGWVFQERLLAPRILQFGKRQVYWRCSELFACETWPQGARSSDNDGLRLGTDLDGLDGNGPLEMQPLQDTAEIPMLSLLKVPVVRWERLVTQYSCTELTYPEDKLVALSGVAEVYQQVLGDRYLAGLWRTGLERLLCWRRDNEKERNPRPKPKYRAPSWSWASIDGPICFTTTTRPHPLLWVEHLLRHIEAAVVHNETAQIKNGHIKVKAVLRSIKVTTERDLSGSEERLEFKAEVGGKELHETFHVVIDIVLDDELDNLSLWAMPTLLVVEKEDWDAPIYTLEGLLLRESCVQSGAYERIGYFSYYASDPYIGSFDEFGIDLCEEVDSSDESQSLEEWIARTFDSFFLGFDVEIDSWPTITIF